MSSKKKEMGKPKKKPIQTFHAQYARYTFTYRIVDPETGEGIYKVNPTTGQKLTNMRGQFIFETKQEDFKTVEGKLSRGFHSTREWDPNDTSFQNQEICKELNKLADKPTPDVLNDEDWQKLKNSAVWKEKQRTKDLESRLAEQTALNEELQAKIAKYEVK